MATVSRSRYNDLADLGVHELANRLEFAEALNAGLRRIIQCALCRDLVMCGDVLDPTTSCQLPRDHGGLHTWISADGGLFVQWG